MRNTPRPCHLFAAVMLVTFFAMPIYAIAQTDTTMPQIMQQNDITYVTGGIGDDEKAALEAVKGEYNLHILNANADGAYVGDTHLSITDKAGTEVLSSDAGPIFYAKLPAGRYSITETHRDQTKKQSVSITRKTSNIHFAWKPATL